MANDGMHTCPKRGCTRQIPYRLFACGPHWYALSKPVQSAIYATVGKFATRERIDAIKAAREEWGDLAAARTEGDTQP